MAAILVHGGAGRWDIADRTLAVADMARAARSGLGVAHGTEAMPHAWRRRGEPGVTAHFAAGRIPA